MKLKALAALFAFAAASASQASVVQIETALSYPGVQADGAAYKSAVDAALAGNSYQSATPASYDNLTHSSLFASGHGNFAWKGTVTFNVATAGDWAFRVAADFGGGGSVFFDGMEKETIRWDIYEPGFGNAANYFDFSVANLSAGNHTLNVYGFENCCDGVQRAQYSMGNTGQFTAFSTADGLDPVSLPEPGSLGLAATGLALLGYTRRRQKVAGGA